MVTQIRFTHILRFSDMGCWDVWRCDLTLKNKDQTERSDIRGTLVPGTDEQLTRKGTRTVVRTVDRPEDISTLLKHLGGRSPHRGRRLRDPGRPSDQ